MEISKKSQKITKVREALGLSVIAFTARCGYISSSISRLEQSEYGISDEFLEKISAVYGMNLVWLMDDTDEGDENHVDDSQMFTAGKSYGRRFVPVDAFAPAEQGARVISTNLREKCTKQNK